MLGYGSIDHLDLLVNANNNYGCSGSSGGSGGSGDKTLCCRNEYRSQLWKATTTTTNNTNPIVVQYKSKDNVYIRYQGAHGKLTVARDSGFAAPDRFGPELMFGWTVGDAFRKLNAKANVLLIKTAWGGKDLGVDFRPPSSGLGKYPGKKPKDYGRYYRKMIQEVKKTLSNLAEYAPTYNDRDGYDLMGFIWFQGWNDFVQAPMIKEYGYNLANLIRDVRHDLRDSNLPVVIGELGMHGTVLNPKSRRITGRAIAMRAQQYDVTLLPEFRNNTLFVRTAPFVIPKKEESYNFNYHYWGRADTFFQIGKALGRGILQLLGMTIPVSQDVCPQPWPQRNGTAQYHCDAVTYCSSPSASTGFCRYYPL